MGVYALKTELNIEKGKVVVLPTVAILPLRTQWEYGIIVLEGVYELYPI